MSDDGIAAVNARVGEWKLDPWRIELWDKIDREIERLTEVGLWRGGRTGGWVGTMMDRESTTDIQAHLLHKLTKER